MTNKQRRRDLREALYTLSLYKSFNINNIIFNRVVNGVVITHPDSWRMFSSTPNEMVSIMYSPRRAIQILWRLLDRAEYMRHDLFWRKMEDKK
jgi:hypothetical protein